MSKIKCPECQIAHRSESTAQHCRMVVENQWGHFIILCYGMEGGVNEENLSVYKHINIEYYKEIKSRKEALSKYYKHNEWGN